MNIKDVFGAVADRFRDATSPKRFPRQLTASPYATQLLREEMIHDAQELGMTDTQIKKEQPVLIAGDDTEIPVETNTKWSGFRVEAS